MRLRHEWVSFCFAGFAAVVWSFLLSSKYIHFGFYDWDMSLCAHTLWNFSRGDWFSTLYGANPFVDHGYYIALPLALAYKVLPSPVFLIILKILVFTSASILIYRIASTLLSSTLALLMQVLFLVFPANIYMMLFEFNFENLAVFLIPFVFWTLLKGHKRLYIAGLISLCLVKENMPLVVMMVGFLAIFLKKEKRLFWALAPMVIGAFIFCAGMFVITPFLRSSLPGGASNLYWGMYKHVVCQPLNLLTQIFSSVNADYLKDLLGAHIPFLWFSPHAFMVALPLLFQAILSKTPSMHTIYFHYTASIVPIIFLATIFSFAWLRSRWSSRIFHALVGLFVVGSLVHMSAFIPDWRNRINAWEDPHDKYRAALVAATPYDRPVIATFDFLSHVVDRGRVYALYNIWQGINYFTGEKPYQRAQEADLALLDMMDPWLLADLKADPVNTSTQLRTYFSMKTWHIVKMHDNVAMLSSIKEINDDQIPIFIQGAPFKDAVLKSLSDPGISLENIDLIMSSDNQLDGMNLAATFYWGVTKNPEHFYFVYVRLEHNDRVVYANTRLLGLSLSPAAAWLPGEHIRENFVHALPKLSSGDYNYRIFITDGITGKKMLWDDSKESFDVKMHIN